MSSVLTLDIYSPKVSNTVGVSSSHKEISQSSCRNQPVYRMYPRCIRQRNYALLDGYLPLFLKWVFCINR